MVRKKDVNPSEPSPEETVVNPEEETSIQEPTLEETTPQPQEPPTPEGVEEGEEEVDERGVPLKNLAMEYKRKYEDLTRSIPQIVEEAVGRAIPQAPQAQPTQYSKEQLLYFKGQASDPQQIAWADNELEKIRSEETRQLFTGLLKEKETKDNFQQEQRDSLGMVFQKYPVMFNPDGSWNNNHPLTQKLSRIYNSREVFKKDGYGLLGAADMAFAELALEQQPQLAKSTKTLKRQVKQLQKQTQLEGGGQPPAQPSKGKLQRTAEEHFVKGDRGTTQAVMKEWLKAKGFIQSE